MYECLIEAIKRSGYTFQTFRDYLREPQNKVVILRHDIDEKKQKALEFAELEKCNNVSATYYFRILPVSFSRSLIQRIESMGHEIGYHYEDLSRNKGNIEKAIQEFETNLSTFRSFSQIDTICMHGAALSKYDNRDLWKDHDYRNYGIIGEPYLDLDFHKVLYLTDSGQCWDGEKYTVRDKTQRHHNIQISNTEDIMSLIHMLPSHLMITTHPNRWASGELEWLVLNSYLSFKRQIKRVILRRHI